MSVDDRLRHGLARNASAYDPDVETRLRELSLRREAARPSHLRRVWLPVAAACAVAALVLSAIALHVARRAAEPAHQPPSAQAAQVLTGTLRTTVPDVPGSVRKDHLSGHWMLRLAADGTMRVAPPSRYGGVRSGAFFDSTATEFRTSLFGQDLCSNLPLGRYTWQRHGSRVRFHVSDDPCAGRVAVLTDRVWRMP